MTLPAFKYQAAQDLPSALEAVAAGAIPYCGGTELLAAMSMGLLRPEEIVSLRLVKDLRGIDLGSTQLSLGATTHHRELIHSELVRAHAPLLSDMAQRIGNARVRAQGTIGGNLAFAEPRSDLSTALIALGAKVTLSNQSSTREELLAEFLAGPYETTLNEGELLVHVTVPKDAADISIYKKVTITERPVVGVAVVHLRESDMWRVVIGAVGEQPLIREAADLRDINASEIAAEVDVLADHSGSDEYKRRLTEVTVTRCCGLAAHKQQESGVES